MHSATEIVLAPCRLQNPIPSFELPMNLMDWFPQQQVKKKREEIRNVILKLCEAQSRGKKGQELKVAEAPSWATWNLGGLLTGGAFTGHVVLLH